MQVELNLGEGVSLLSNYIDQDWTRFYLKFDDVLLPLGAESLEHVRKWLSRTLWREYENQRLSFYLNFNKPHSSLYILHENEQFRVRVEDRDGVLLFHRQLKDCFLLKDEQAPEG